MHDAEPEPEQEAEDEPDMEEILEDLEEEEHFAEVLEDLSTGDADTAARARRGSAAWYKQRQNQPLFTGRHICHSWQSIAS